MGLLDKLEIPEEMRPAFEAAVRFGVDPKAVVIVLSVTNKNWN